MTASNATLRRSTIETLALLADRYPNLRLGQIIGNAMGDAHDMYYVSDAELARSLSQLFVSLTQFEAAGIRP